MDDDAVEDGVVQRVRHVVREDEEGAIDEGGVATGVLPRRVRPSHEAVRGDEEVHQERVHLAEEAANPGRGYKLKKDSSLNFISPRFDERFPLCLEQIDDNSLDEVEVLRQVLKTRKVVET